MSLGLGLAFIMNSSLAVGGWSPAKYEPEFGSEAFDTLRQCPGVELLQFKSKGRLAHFESIMIVDHESETVRISFPSGTMGSALEKLQSACQRNTKLALKGVTTFWIPYHVTAISFA